MSSLAKTVTLDRVQHCVPIGGKLLLKMVVMFRKIVRYTCSPCVTVILKEGSHIGHGAVIHGATIGKNCLVGMNSVIMYNVVLGDECIIGALTFIKQHEIFPTRSLIIGNPGKIIK